MSESDAEGTPAFDWRLRTIEANIAQLRRELTRHQEWVRGAERELDRRVIVLEIRLAVYAALGGLVGGLASALIVALVVAQT